MLCYLSCLVGKISLLQLGVWRSHSFAVCIDLFSQRFENCCLKRSMKTTSRSINRSMKLANRSIRRSKQKANRGILKLLVDGDQKGIKTKLLKFLKEKKKKKEKKHGETASTH